MIKLIALLKTVSTVRQFFCWHDFRLLFGGSF
jgi:hypothetical protein